ncbi:CHAD domain-containing protein [Patulibacter minatonensis]|uniref:CHAD domain-containing protein n=1 Tax=Patulibacter minatonensis TaxID=298163 RepID=UPI000479B6D5|nr:CHAD domain-containing protein [Patulibacter minatonensis]
MSFRIDLRPPVPEAVRAVALERLDRVMGELSGERSDDVATAVHEARKDLKKTRSLVRLLKPGLPKARYREEADALRSVSRSLGGRREADALVETVDALRDPAAGHVPAATLDRLREALVADAPSGGGDDLDGAVRAVAEIRSRVADGALDVDGRTALAAGLARTYARGYAAFAAADEDPTAERLHDWRKRVKDLWYQQALLSPVWPTVLGAQAEEARALSKVLGADHDLDALDVALRDPSGPVAHVAGDTDALLPVVEARRAELLVVARAHGLRLHAERPRAYARRSARYLDAPPLPR